MAQMSQEMFGAKGKVGNKVYMTTGGKTVARTLVTPKNPKTDLQTLQRVIASQVGKTYKKFKDICDHSFEGYTNGAKCANRFRQLNMRKIRERAAEIQQAGQSLSEFYNFSPIGSEKWAPGAAILAQGSLRQIFPGIITVEDEFVGNVAIAANTYAGVASAFGANRGDQITFITVNQNAAGEYDVNKARIILDPREDDGSGASMQSPFIYNEALVKPNWKNAGTFTVLTASDNALNFNCGQGTLVAVAIIASRKVDNVWYRSNAQLVISEEALGSDKCSIMDAVNESYSGGNVDLESELYLNNAGEGGGQSSGSNIVTTDPYISNDADVNGVSQRISGGSVNVTAPLSSVVIKGVKLDQLNIKGYLGESEVAGTMNAAKTQISFAPNATAGQTFTIKQGDPQEVFVAFNVVAEASAEPLAAPVISGDTPFADTSSVTIAAPAGSTVYYTTDGSNPTTASTQYTGTITLTETTTVKAIAVKNGETSDVAVKAFVKSSGGGGGFEG